MARTDRSSRDISIFLCGGSMTSGSARKLFLSQCKHENNLSVKFPEGLFDELLEKNAFNLLELEEILANSVDAIVIFPESPGSFAEIGAFAESKSLRKKTICILDKKHSRSFSFINLGPVNILKKNKPSKVIDFNYKLLDQPTDARELVKTVTKQARQIKAELPSHDFGLFHIEELIKCVLFCLDQASWKEIKSTFYANSISLSPTAQDKIFEICLNVLLSTSKIEKNDKGKLRLSNLTTLSMLNSMPRQQLRYLQRIRVEAMNSQLRRHAEFKHDRVSALPL